jgi:GntR family transcriptional repressor for pyruvate dehydrogenase complex
MPRLHKEMMWVLIGEIVGGTLPAGSKLPREADLASHYDVSRGVARECIRGLEERGLVHVKHGRGATVTDMREWDLFDPDVLAALLKQSNSARVLADYLECRRILEIEAAGLAAERATAHGLAALSAAFERMVVAADRARLNPAAESIYQEADIAFHRSIVAATENHALVRMTEPIHKGLSAAVPALARPEARLEHGLPEHERIVSAITERDAERARAAMREHLLTLERYLREYAHNQGDGGVRPKRRRAAPRATRGPRP